MVYLKTNYKNDGVLSLVRKACQRYSEEIAIDAGTNKISYRQLDNDANRLAHSLIHSDSGSGVIVAVIVGDRVHLPIYMLGILRAGCVFVPLNPRAPKLRLQKLLSELQPDVLIMDSPLPGDIQDLDSLLRKPCRLINVQDYTSVENSGKWIKPLALAPQDAGKHPPDIEVNPDSMSYIYYTSGSTGRPKGIAGRLQAVSHRIAWELNEFDITSGWRVSQLISSTFDPYLRDTFVPLCSGGTLCIPPSPTNLMSQIELLDWIRNERIQLIHAVPSLFSAIASAPTRAHDLTDLKLVLLSGEPLHVASVLRWQRRFGKGARLINLYGTTEATMFQFFHEIDASDLKRGFIPIGRPIEGDTATLVDENGSICSQGTAGEICIFSPFLSLGYYGQEELTKMTFERLDASENDPPDFYKTGDLAVEIEDGNYRLLGRKDSQIKIRGVRIELSEIEAALMEYPLISECCVTACQYKDKRVVVAAHIESPSWDQPSIPELRLHLRERLLPEMMPTHFVFVNRLPRADNGKIDRVALAEKEITGLIPVTPAAPPQNQYEEWLVGIWKELLVLDSVGIHDDFLALGGHSIIATQLVSRIRKDFGIDVPVSAVFEHSNIVQLALHIMQTGKSDVSKDQDFDLLAQKPSFSEAGM